MVDFKSVLGTLLESGLAPSASQRIGHAVKAAGRWPRLDPERPRRRSARGAAVATSAPCWGACSATRKQAAGDTKQQVQAGNPMAVGGVGALAGALLGGVRGSPAKGAIGGAALAVLGQIAMSALQKGRRAAARRPIGLGRGGADRCGGVPAGCVSTSSPATPAPNCCCGR